MNAILIINLLNKTARKWTLLVLMRNGYYCSLEIKLF